MKIRRGSVSELESLWDYSCSNTYHYFIEGMKSETIEFWTIEHASNQLIGELYIFWDSEDKDEADGFKRAYLCALRIHKDYQGNGLSSKLMKTVLKRICEKGFSEVSIGIDNDDYEKLYSIYNAWGFNEFIKKQTCDYHYLDKNNKPVVYEKPIELYLRKFGE